MKPLLLIFALMFSMFIHAEPTHDYSTEFYSKTHHKGIVTGVVDGDTIDVEIDLGYNIKMNTRIRMLKVDTPEKRGASSNEKLHAQQASDFTYNKVFNKKVLVVGDSHDVYGRVLADIYYDEDGRLVLLSDQLKSNGFQKKKVY